MNLKTKTTNELLQLMEGYENLPRLQLISLDTYKNILKELKEKYRFDEIEDMNIKQNIFDKDYYFKLYTDGDIEGCLEWIGTVNKLCRLMCD